MRYMVLIYVDPSEYAGMTKEQGDAEMAAYFALGPQMKEKGVEIAGEALHPVATATTVRVRDGETIITDGPFAETKEHLGGYYIVNAEDLDQAIEFAKMIPDAVRGSIEVRPVVEF